MNEKKKKLLAAAKGALLSAVAVPAMGVVSHCLHGGLFAADDSSLANRFETAYNINANPEHKFYTSYEVRPVSQRSRFQDEYSTRHYINNEGLEFDNTWVEYGSQYDNLYSEEKYAGIPLNIYPLHLLVAGLGYMYFRRKDEEREMLDRLNQKTR